MLSADFCPKMKECSGLHNWRWGRKAAKECRR